MSLDSAFSSCNSKQKTAAKFSINTHLLIVAAPGSGKTLTLTLRIAFLITKGVKPEQIFAVSFTKKAAIDMKKRLVSLLPKHYLLDGMSLGTFHHCALSILRANAKTAGISWKFTILSGQKQKQILEEALLSYLENHKLETLMSSSIKCLPSDKLKDWISHDYEENKTFAGKIPFNSFKFINSVICSSKVDCQCLNSLTPEFLELFSIYNSFLRKHKAIDLSDILYLSLNLLKNNPKVLEKYQKKFKFLFVDEFQDTNTMQLEFLSLLGKNSVFTVCGDDDQAIYSWRGSSDNIFYEFKALFPDCDTVILNQNYRSTQSIVAASQNLISNNKFRTTKDIFANNEIGTMPEIIIAENSKKEAEIVARLIEFYADKGFKYENIAVLYRLNKIYSEIFSEMEKRFIPVKTRKKVVYLNENETRIVSFLKLIINTSDDEAFMTIFNWPKRKLAEGAKKRIQYISSYKNLSLFESLKFLVTSTSKCLKGFSDLFNAIQSFILDSQSLGLFELVTKMVLDFRVNNAQNLLALSEVFLSSGNQCIQDFLQSIDCGEDADSITLTTIHQAKGREWDIVIVARVNEGFLPSGKDVEEERRLAYVAATRARKILIITCAMNGSQGEYFAPSRFIEELFDKNLKLKTCNIGLTKKHL